MPTALMGMAEWPGVTGFISCSYTASHGATPGIATLEIPEQDINKIESFGTLTISDGARTIALPRCRIVTANYNQGDGRTIVLSIADRRWMWQYGQITANWNQIDQFPDISLPQGTYTLNGGPYVPGTYRLASDMIRDCFAAMNETNFAFTVEPNVVIPVQWDVEVPAQALQGILDQIGFRLCYRPADDTVLVSPAGQGRTLPDNLPFTTNHPSFTLPTRPNAIGVVGGDSLYYDQLLLEPWAPDWDGTIKPIAQLSYAPKVTGIDEEFGGQLGGWGYCPPPTMGTVQATAQLSQYQAIELAKKYVWRMFRVKMGDVADTENVKSPGPKVAGYDGQIKFRQQIALQPSIIGGTTELNGQPTSLDAFVTGSVYVAGAEGNVPLGIASGIVNGNTDQLSQIPLPYKPSVDVARQVVTFDRQMFMNIGGAQTIKFGNPILYLNTSFKILDVIGRVPNKFSFGVSFSGNGAQPLDNSDLNPPGLPNLGCPPQVLRHPELVLASIAARDINNKRVLSVTSNLTYLNQAAQYYIAQANAQYTANLALDRTYAGIWPISPDGAIRQVTWSVGGGRPATTQASMNSEHSFYLPRYAELRRNEQTKDWARKEELRQLLRSTGTNMGSQGTGQLPPAAAGPLGIW